jgi:outer membrane protein OmpA-like peptidoglycan-associated protein
MGRWSNAQEGILRSNGEDRPMTTFSLTTRAFRSSTAILVALTMTSAPHAVRAQVAEVAPGTVAVDCAVNPTDPACAVDPEVELDPLPDLQTNEPVAAEVLEEVAPADDALADPVTPAEETVEREAELNAPVVEEPTVEIETTADTEPEVEQSVEVEVTETPSGDEAVTEVPAEEASSPEAPPTDIESAPLADTDEQPAEASTDLPEETAQDSEPAEIPPAPLPAPTTEAADTEPVVAESSETDASATATTETDAPAAVIPDDATAEQAAAIQAQEAQRREDARDRRAELLGAAAVGAVVGALIPALGGRVVEDQGDRLIVERDGEFFVRGDESSLLREGDADVRVERRRGGRTQETITRRNGAQIITIRDEGGYILYRSRIRPNGREIVLIDNRHIDDRAFIDERDLPPLQLTIPRDRYVVPAQQADFDVFFETFAAPTVVELDETYTLRQVRENAAVRDLVRRVDLDSITFETGQATVRRSQVPLLEDIALATLALIDRDPSTLLLVEGHTDAIGSDISNLALSDRRAETVARILVNFYDVPPENLVIQGYGERYLKIDTQAAEEQNRRVTIRNITPLIGSAN